MQLFHLGDLEYSLPLAAAVLTWLLAARAWRAAVAWAVLYAGALGLVGASKIAYLGWGLDIAALGFKAVSGHATGVTAVYPLAAYLLCRVVGRGLARAGACAGLGLGAVVTVGLVILGEHTVAEAASGWLLGACASIATLYQLEQPGRARRAGSIGNAGEPGNAASPGRIGSSGRSASVGSIGSVGYLVSACCAVLVFVASASLMQSAHVGYWMIKVALALSGNAQPFPWDSCG
jgi:hypothetical protein